MTEDTTDDSWLEGDAAEAPAGLLSKRALSDLTGLAPKKIDALVRSGMPATPGTSSRAGYSFDLKAVIAWLADGQGATTTDPLALARQRKAAAEAERIERQNRAADGDLISAKEVRREIAFGMSHLRQELLAIPTRLTSQSDDVRATIKAEIVAAINAMALTHGGDDAKA